MENQSKKEMKEQYKNRVVVGGIYCIECNDSGHRWIKSTRDIAGQINKFDFFISTNSCPEPGMRSDWDQYGVKSFSMVILEELEKGETQTDKEFADDIRILQDMWIEKKQMEEPK
jgi:hypothetical protein